ncbi:MAG: hypothetical protein WCG98_05015 [bacterium]
MEDKLDKTLKEYDEMKSAMESMEISYLNSNLKQLPRPLLIDEKDAVLNTMDFKKIVDRAKDHYAKEDWILAKKD